MGRASPGRQGGIGPTSPWKRPDAGVPDPAGLDWPPARRPATKNKTPGEQRGTPGGTPMAALASGQRLTGTGLAIRAHRFERPAWGTKEFLGRWRKPAVAPPATAERPIPGEAFGAAVC